MPIVHQRLDAIAPLSRPREKITMMREQLFELIKKAGLERIETCCPGVEYKLCSNDVWKGDLSALITVLKKEVKEEYDREVNQAIMQFSDQLLNQTLLPGVANRTLLAPGAAEAIQTTAAMLKSSDESSGELESMPLELGIAKYLVPSDSTEPTSNMLGRGMTGPMYYGTISYKPYIPTVEEQAEQDALTKVGEQIPDYKAFLEHSFARDQEFNNECPALSRLSWVGDAIFDFTTYDDGQSEIMAIKALEVCHAISTGTTFKYIEDQENYTWYLIMCNHAFFEKRIEWGTSIRGAWWDHAEFELESCSLYLEDKQLLKLKFASREKWIEFLGAVIAFVADDSNRQETVSS